MGSRKPSAKAKQVARFRENLAGSGDIFARERQHQERLSAKKEAALRKKACESKNRYRTEAEARAAIAACADYGTTGLHCYRCPHCDGWHLTSKSYGAHE